MLVWITNKPMVLTLRLQNLRAFLQFLHIKSFVVCAIGIQSFKYQKFRIFLESVSAIHIYLLCLRFHYLLHLLFCRFDESVGLKRGSELVLLWIIFSLVLFTSSKERIRNLCLSRVSARHNALPRTSKHKYQKFLIGLDRFGVISNMLVTSCVHFPSHNSLCNASAASCAISFNIFGQLVRLIEDKVRSSGWYLSCANHLQINTLLYGNRWLMEVIVVGRWTHERWND